MKRLSYILLSLAVALVFNVSCEKDIQDVTSCEGLKICAEIVNNQAASKVDFTPVKDYGLKLTWNSDKSDKIFGYWTNDGGTTKNTIILNVDELSNGNTRAVFKLADGGGALPTGTATFYLICAPAIPQGVTGGSAWNEIQISLGEQTGELANLKDYAYLCATGTPVIKGNGATLDLKFTNQYSVLSITSFSDLKDGGKYVRFSAEGLTNCGKIEIHEVNSENVFEFIPKSSTLSDEDKSISLSKDITTVNETNPLYVLIPTGSQDLDLSEIKVSVFAEGATNALSQKNLGKHKISQSMCYQITNISFKEFEWLSGEFTIKGKKYNFAKGNLYWDGSGWAFESEQYDCNTGSKYWNKDNLVSSTEPTLADKLPEKDIISYFNYNTLYNQTNSSLNLNSDMLLLTLGEWEDLLNSGNVVYRRGTVCGVKGLIFTPSQTASKTSALTSIGNFTTNVINTVSDWKLYEKEGAVFLPVTGKITTSDGAHSTLFSDKGGDGSYLCNNSKLQALIFTYSSFQYSDRPGDGNRYAVRLVREVPAPQPAPQVTE